MLFEVILPAEQKERVFASPCHHRLKANSHVPPDHYSSQPNNGHINYDILDQEKPPTLTRFWHWDDPLTRCRFIGPLVGKVRKVRLELSKETDGKTDSEDACCEGSMRGDESELH